MSITRGSHACPQPKKSPHQALYSRVRSVWCPIYDVVFAKRASGVDLEPLVDTRGMEMMCAWQLPKLSTIFVWRKAYTTFLQALKESINHLITFSRKLRTLQWIHQGLESAEDKPQPSANGWSAAGLSSHPREFFGHCQEGSASVPSLVSSSYSTDTSKLIKDVDRVRRIWLTKISFKV